MHKLPFNESFLTITFSNCQDYSYDKYAQDPKNAILKKSSDDKNLFSSNKSDYAKKIKISKFFWKTITILLACIIGITIAVATKNVISDTKQVHTKNANYLKVLTKKRNTISNKYKNIQNIKENIAKKQEKLLINNFPHMNKNKITGRGIVITLTDSKEGSQIDRFDKKRVQDIDIQIIVNSLWKNGAKAISVSGYAINSSTALRSAGGSILVNLQPISSPYIIKAIGNPNKIETKTFGQDLSTYIEQMESIYGIDVNIDRSENIHINSGILPDYTIGSPIRIVR